MFIENRNIIADLERKAIADKAEIITAKINLQRLIVSPNWRLILNPC